MSEVGIALQSSVKAAMFRFKKTSLNILGGDTWSQRCRQAESPHKALLLT
jgi:hypothetical protein